jgi:prepilin-type N-terminal cleavage/methylation domain-containing protein
MLNKLKKPNSKGFTIIEVMIVLAIAGLILLIVFLAVPALQRNSRNTQRKNDAANISAGIGTYLSNNNGILPNGIGNGTAGSVDLCAVGGTTSGALGAACGSGNTETARIGYYNQGNVYINKTATSGSPVTVTSASAVGSESATAVSTQSVLLVFNESCGAAGTGQFTNRSVAVFYVTESASGNGSLQCVS